MSQIKVAFDENKNGATGVAPFHYLFLYSYLTVKIISLLPIMALATLSQAPLL